MLTEEKIVLKHFYFFLHSKFATKIESLSSEAITNQDLSLKSMASMTSVSVNMVH